MSHVKFYATHPRSTPWGCRFEQNCKSDIQLRTEAPNDDNSYRAIICDHLFVHSHEYVTSLYHSTAAEQRKHLGYKDSSLIRGQLKVVPHVFAFDWLPFDSQSTKAIVHVTLCNVIQEMFDNRYLWITSNNTYCFTERSTTECLTCNCINRLSL